MSFSKNGGLALSRQSLLMVTLIFIVLSGIIGESSKLTQTIKQTIDATYNLPAPIPTSRVSDYPFNYTAFWQDVMDRVKPDLTTNIPHYELATCPKVFVYDLKNDLRDGPADLNFTRAFGIAEGKVHQTGQYQLGRILQYRIMSSKYCVTKDPQKADLFYVPIFPDGRSVSLWDKSCKNHKAILKSLLRQLQHLTPETACKHFFVVSKSFEAGTKCKGWWSDPVSAFAPAMRVSYTERHFGLKGMKTNFYGERNDTHRYPNRVAVPYPSSLHWQHGKDAPWEPEEQQPRNVYTLFVGRLSHGDMPVRSEIERQCDTVYLNDPNKCKLSTDTNNGKSGSQLVEEKLDAVFCLEPGGDTPDRKSISDSIASGCIPVLFNNITGTGWDMFWGPWKAQGHVSVPREPFIRGEVDLHTLLRTTMPQELRHIMQETLRTYARQFQYSIDEDSNDGIRIMLEGLKDHAKRRIENGQCRQA